MEAERKLRQRNMANRLNTWQINVFSRFFMLKRIKNGWLIERRLSDTLPICNRRGMQIMEGQVREWGNSQEIRFPKTVLQKAGIASV